MRLGAAQLAALSRMGSPVPQTLALSDVRDQGMALRRLANVAAKSVFTPIVQLVAKQIIASCPGRDDDCELHAIYDSVKYGNPNVPALARGFKYIADTPLGDVFTSPRILLENCLRGACGEDCDGHAALVSALASAIGFEVGLQAWGPGPAGSPLIHVYAIAKYPKRAPRELVVMDTSVENFVLGSRPNGGHTLTAWLE